MIKRFRAHVKRSKYGAPAWRILVGVIGGLVTVFGAIALIKTKMLAIKTAQRALPADTRKSVIYLIVGVVVVAIAIGAGISYYLFAR